jgi:hypothetical protein
MARLPDRFDLWVRKAKECEDARRQVDYVLGALAGLKEWHFLNLGTKEKPQAARTEIEEEAYLLVFSDTGRIEEVIREQGGARAEGPLPVISIAAEVAMAWAVECRTGLFVNPPEDAVMIPFSQVEAFYAEWKKRGARRAAGFWIPTMTSEEEDFWEEHGY